MVPSSTWIALCLISTEMLRTRQSSLLRVATFNALRSWIVGLTGSAIPDDGVEGSDKVGEYRVYVIEAGEDGDDVGARVRILLGQDAGQEDAEGLGARG